MKVTKMERKWALLLKTVTLCNKIDFSFNFFYKQIDIKTHKKTIQK